MSTNSDASPRSQEWVPVLQSLRWWLRALTIAVVLMTLALLLTVAAVFGSLVNYFDGAASLFGGVAIGAAVLGFGFGVLAGWLARRQT
jgi:membrane associated rhomboid family serine protease